MAVVTVERSSGVQMSLRTFCRLIYRLTKLYRPEAHYMRGPGPKCRAKLESER